MKRIILLGLSLLVLLSTAACSVLTRQGRVLSSLGKCESEQFWTHGGFQDYTDFGVYSFPSAKLQKNRYFSAVTEADIITIRVYIGNFQMFVNTYKKNNPDDELAVNYSFDSSIIDTDDYFYIYEKGEFYSNYDVYFFDTQTNQLYYFHNNI